MPDLSGGPALAAGPCVPELPPGNAASVANRLRGKPQRKDCRHQGTVTAGTFLDNTCMPLRVWLARAWAPTNQQSAIRCAEASSPCGVSVCWIQAAACTPTSCLEAPLRSVGSAASRRVDSLRQQHARSVMQGSLAVMVHDGSSALQALLPWCKNVLYCNNNLESECAVSLSFRPSSGSRAITRPAGGLAAGQKKHPASPLSACFSYRVW